MAMITDESRARREYEESLDSIDVYRNGGKAGHPTDWQFGIIKEKQERLISIWDEIAHHPAFTKMSIASKPPDSIGKFLGMLIETARMYGLSSRCEESGISAVEMRECVDYLNDTFKASLY